MIATGGSVDRVIHTVLSRQPFELELSDVATDGRLEIFPHVEDKGLLFLQFRRNKLIVTAGAYIGLIPLSPRIVFDVRPKLPVRNLARVIDAARRSLSSIPGTDRLYLTSEALGSSILEFLAVNLVEALRPIATNGLYKEYVRRTELTGNPRGRMEIAGTLRAWSQGQFHKLQSERSEQSSNVVPNRVIKAALEVALRLLAPTNSRALTRINAAYIDLPNAIGDLRAADCDLARELLSKRRLPLGRTYYYRAIEIALLILSNHGIALQQLGSDIQLESFIINFDDLFEEYLRRVLQLRAPKGLSVTDGNNEGRKPLFSDRADPHAQPDVVLKCTTTGRIGIGEIKYKERPARDDINQAVTYAVSYGTDRAVLIHQSKSGGSKGLSCLGMIGGIRLDAYAFDLDSDDLETEEVLFSEAIYKLAAPVAAEDAAQLG